MLCIQLLLTFDLKAICKKLTNLGKPQKISLVTYFIAKTTTNETRDMIPAYHLSTTNTNTHHFSDNIFLFTAYTQLFNIFLSLLPILFVLSEKKHVNIRTLMVEQHVTQFYFTSDAYHHQTFFYLFSTHIFFHFPSCLLFCTTHVVQYS